MARRSGKRGDGEERRPPRLPSELAEDVAADDQLFREAMANLTNVPVKDAFRDPESLPRGARPSTKDRVIKIDLHRLTMAEAEARVDGVLKGLLAGLHSAGASVRVQIITGKGRHSGDGGAVLAREVHRYVRQRYAGHIISIEDSPADLVVGGLPIRGHFHVTLGTKIR